MPTFQDVAPKKTCVARFASSVDLKPVTQGSQSLALDLAMTAAWQLGKFVRVSGLFGQALPKVQQHSPGRLSALPPSAKLVNV